MRLSLYRKLAFLPLLALALGPFANSSAAVTLKSPVTAECETWNFEAEASGLLKQIGTLSRKLHNDAGTLESFKRQPTLSWQSHAAQLNRTREHINSIGERLDRLQAIQSITAPWQQRAIREIVPVAATLAAHTESAIQHLNDNRSYLFAPVYAEHLTAIAERSGELKDSVDAFLEFGNTSEKYDRLQQKLERLQEKIGLSES